MRNPIRHLVTPSLAILALAACADHSALLDVPSEVSVAAPGFTQAMDSARGIARLRIRRGNLPGASIAVGRDGQLVWAEAFGWADLSRDTPATPTTLYPVGSISKSLTSVAAGKLYERGLLDFDVPIQTYLPEFPEKQWPITTGQLMGHIAGVIRGSTTSEVLRYEHCANARAAITMVAEDTLIFEPGTRYSYSNYGWTLVGAVVEAAAGEPYLEFMDREVFTPAGMEQTVPDLGDEGERESVKYDRAAFGSLRRAQAIDMSCPMAAGGFLSTPTELVRFGYAMLNRELLEPATIDLFWTPQRLKSGAPIAYGYGWGIENVRLGDDQAASTPMIGHGGSVPGGQGYIAIFPDENMVVAVMTNSSADVSGFAREIAGIFRAPR